ncbi:Nudix hydrolase YfcD [Klebsiella pneumoniae]|uniref:Nudix hydrolase YfcD n=1 Tax=Klebsiella pneumoniae TaxID=573 RepID=A0A2X3F2Z5_KLEPN|nr:Nudix hydrolase YfcD [Klebsiella pneumoniae]
MCWLTPEEITARCDEFTPDSLKALGAVDDPQRR